MPAIPLTFSYDPDRFIHVPLDYVETPWADAAAWADWLSDEAMRARPDGDAFRAAVREEALAVALFPAEHVSARFWHYRVDQDPSGFVDLYVQSRSDDASTPAELLPDLGFTAVEPVVESQQLAPFDSSTRRLSIGVVLPTQDAEPVLLPRAEWLGITPQWVCYAISTDHDLGSLEQRLDDIGALFEAVDLSALTVR